MKKNLAFQTFLVLQLLNFSTLHASNFVHPLVRVPASQSVDVETRAKVMSLLRKLNDTDAKVRSATAAELASPNFAYLEVSQALVKLMESEIKSEFGNSYVLGEALKAYKANASRSQIKEINALSDLFSRSSNPGLIKSKSYIEANFLTATQEISFSSKPELVSLGTGPEAKGFKDFLLSKTGDAETILLKTIDTYLSDNILAALDKNENFSIVGRQEEANEVIDTLVRIKGKNPVLVGPRGAGKTSIAEKVAEIIAQNKLPVHPAYQDELKGAIVIQTTPAKISRLAQSDSSSAQSAAVEIFFDAILEVEKTHGKKIVLFIDEIHTFSGAQVEAMKPYLDSKDRAIRLIGASTSTELQNSFKNNPAILRRFHEVGVSEQKIAEVLQIFKESFASQILKKYSVRFTDEAAKIIVTFATRTNPDTSRVDGSFKLAQSLAAQLIRDQKTQAVQEITEEMAYKSIGDKLGFPVSPLNPKALLEYKAELVRSMNEVVIGQERMVEDVISEYVKLLKPDQDRGVRNVLLLGPTGTGKSLLGRELAKKLFGREGAYLEIDANKFKTGGFSNNSAFGAPNGVLSSDKTAGSIFDYLDDSGRGKMGGIILINEAEKAHPDFWENMMEMMDTGRATGGDGKDRTLHRHLIILTSNRGDHIVYPTGASENWTESEVKAQMAAYDSDRLKKLFTEATSGKDEFRLPDAVLARIDKASLAAPMTESLVIRTMLVKAKRQIEKLEQTYRIKIQLDPAIVAAVVRSSFKYGMGARPVEKALDEHLMNAFQKAVSELNLVKGDSLELKAEASGLTRAILISSTKGNAKYSLPSVPSKDPLQDPELVAKLSKLGEVVKSRVIGQDSLVDRFVDAVIAHQATRLTNKKPLSLFAVGTTGTGKTEMAKALALGLYGSESRAEIIALGKVRFEGDLNMIFNSPAGYKGSDQIFIFEQALINNPNGGVIVFDEASNMGGKDKAMKEALFKEFYNMMDEGRWHSSVTNKTYDLSKYTFLFTGNDGEKLFQKNSADDLRMSTWKRNQSGQNLRALLREAGIPEAFLGRLADLVLYKPLMRAEVAQVTEKILKDVLKDFAQQGLQLKYDQKFLNDFSEVFFTQDRGGRSIKNVIETKLKSGLVQIVIKNGGFENLKSKSIVIRINDNQSQRTYAKTTDPDRLVQLQLDLMGSAGLEKTYSFEATDFAEKTLKPSLKMALSTAYHEAGHAVVNEARSTGENVAYITIRGADNYLGYARYEELQKNVIFSNLTEKIVIDRVARLLAGQIAQKMAGHQEDAGWANDLEQARALISSFLIDYGMGRNLKAIAVDANRKPRLSYEQARQMELEFKRIYQAAESLAQSRLTVRWGLVREVVNELIKTGSITGEQFKDLQAQVEARAATKLFDLDEKNEIRAKQIRKKAVRCEAMLL